MLDPDGASSNQRVFAFLVSRIDPKFHGESPSYSCKACFTAVEKGATAFTVAEKVINDIREKLNLAPALITVTYPATYEADVTPSTTASRKRARETDEDDETDAGAAGLKKQRLEQRFKQRRLFSSPQAGTTSSPQVQVWTAHEHNQLSSISMSVLCTV